MCGQSGSVHIPLIFGADQSVLGQSLQLITDWPQNTHTNTDEQFITKFLHKEALPGGVSAHLNEFCSEQQCGQWSSWCLSSILGRIDIEMALKFIKVQ
jgi:hypothetical protein